MCEQWKDEVLADAPKGSTVMVNKWLARLTLDVIGEGACLGVALLVDHMIRRTYRLLTYSGV